MEGGREGEEEEREGGGEGRREGGRMQYRDGKNIFTG